jgi:hypothetical protein
MAMKLSEAERAGGRALSTKCDELQKLLGDPTKAHVRRTGWGLDAAGWCVSQPGGTGPLVLVSPKLPGVAGGRRELDSLQAVADVIRAELAAWWASGER